MINEKEGIAESGDFSAQDFKCQACGASLEFNPKTQKFFCRYCNNEQDIAVSTNVSERDFAEFHNGESWSAAGIRAVRCENCGAAEMFSNSEVARNCSFCGSSKVLKVDDFHGVKPNCLIPFKLTARQAAESCLSWLKKRIFAPRKFKKQAEVENIHGVYYPVWTFDSQVTAHYSGRVGKRETVTRTDSEGHTHTSTEIRWYNVSGSIFKMFDDILINASERVGENYFNKLQPFNQKDYVRYDNGFLAGFSANSYTVEPETAWKRAEAVIKKKIEEAILKKHNADVMGQMKLNIIHEGKSFKYMLVPIYVTAATYGKKTYNQFVNGVHGKVCGKAPVSPARVSVAAVLGVGLLILIIVLASKFYVF